MIDPVARHRNLAAPRFNARLFLESSSGKIQDRAMSIPEGALVPEYARRRRPGLFDGSDEAEPGGLPRSPSIESVEEYTARRFGFHGALRCLVNPAEEWGLTRPRPAVVFHSDDWSVVVIYRIRGLES